MALSVGTAAVGAQSTLVASLIAGAGATGILAHLGLQADGHRRATDRDGVKKLGKGALAASTVPVYWGISGLQTVEQLSSALNPIMGKNAA